MCPYLHMSICRHRGVEYLDRPIAGGQFQNGKKGLIVLAKLCKAPGRLAIAGISRRTGKFTNMEYGRSWNESNFWGAWLDLQLLSFLLLHHAFFAGQYLWRLPSLVAKSWDDQQARRRHFTTQHGYGYSGNGKSWKVSMFHRSITKEKSTNLHPLIKGFSVCCRFLMATSFGNEKATNACDVCIFPAPLMKIDESAPPIITNRMEIWWNMVIWCSTVMGTKSESGTKSWEGNDIGYWNV